MADDTPSTTADLVSSCIPLQTMPSFMAASFAGGVVIGLQQSLGKDKKWVRKLGEKILADPIGFQLGYALGELNGLLTGLKNLVASLGAILKLSLTVAAAAIEYSSPIVMAERAMSEGWQLLSDSAHRKLRQQQVEAAARIAKAAAHLIDDIQRHPTDYLVFSEEAGRTIGKAAGNWVTQDFVSRSAKDIGKCIGDVVGQIGFEVLFQVLLMIATEGAGNAADLAAEFGEVTRSGSRFAGLNKLLKPIFTGCKGIQQFIRECRIFWEEIELGGKTVGQIGIDAAMAARQLRFGGYEVRMGIPEEHLARMIEAARETDSIAVMRANKSSAIDLIRRGAMPKPKELWFKSNVETGVLTATNSAEVTLARQEGYLVIDADGVARGRLAADEKKIVDAYWKVRPGQVIHANGHPVVGDYDMLGVLPGRSPGRNISVVPDTPEGNWIGPDAKKFMNAVNRRLDKPRVMHGGQDQYGKLTEDVCYAIFPDGRTMVLDGYEDQRRFYAAFERQTRAGSYNPWWRNLWLW